jgi:polysaccharide export outer membrane protein
VKTRRLNCLSLAMTAGLLLSGGLRAAEPPARAAGQRADEFLIGIEDRLRVVVWGEPELSVEVQVRPDGRITVPLVNDLKVVGLAPMEVRDLIAEQLGKFIRDPNVTVIVDEINSFRVYFLGEINTQGTLNFTQPPSLLQAIAAAGGLTEFSKNEVVLVRVRDGAEQRFNINYKQLVAGDPRQPNLFLKPGDTLIFP